jgi:hypothetical protein
METIDIKRKLFATTRTFRMLGILQVAALPIIAVEAAFYFIGTSHGNLHLFAMGVSLVILLILLVPVGSISGPLFLKEYVIQTFYHPTDKEIVEYAAKRIVLLREQLACEQLTFKGNKSEARAELKSLEYYLGVG